MQGFGGGWKVLVLAVAAIAVAGCSSNRAPQRIPVEDRSVAARPAPAPAPAVVAAPAPAPAAPSGPGYYTVKPGDTLIRIGLDTGQNWRDIARWNGIENPNLIEVGQVLRVAANVPAAAPAQARPAEGGPGVVATPVPSTTIVTAPPAAGAASAPATVPPATAGGAPATGSAATSAAGEELAFIWPSGGPLLAGFDEAKNKGYDIGGKVGDAVLAAADGRVVYAGAGLRGYGNLVILKHNNTYLTAYAHNQALLVKEDQAVKKGQKIAEMGSSDADRVKLHFEIRRQGKPVDPARYLGTR